MFGLDDLAMGAQIGGSILGAIGSSKGKKAASQTRPYLPPEYEQGYTDVLKDFKDKVYSQRYQAPVYVRPTGKYDGVAMKYLQNLADNQPQEMAAEQVPAAVDDGAIQRAVMAAMGKSMLADSNTNPLFGFGVRGGRLSYQQMLGDNPTEDDFAGAANAWVNMRKGGANQVDPAAIAEAVMGGLTSPKFNSPYLQNIQSASKGS